VGRIFLCMLMLMVRFLNTNFLYLMGSCLEELRVGFFTSVSVIGFDVVVCD